MEELTKYMVSQDQTIMQVLSCIRECKARSVVVVNEDNKVIGVISQGDVITALLNHQGLYGPAEKIMNRSFVYLHERDMDRAVAVVLDKGISLIPIIDSFHRLVDVISTSDIIEYLRDRRCGMVSE